MAIDGGIMEKINSKTIKTDVDNGEVNYIVSEWVYNYLHVLKPLGLNLNKIKILPVFSSGSSSVEPYVNDGVIVYDYSEEASFKVTYLGNIVRFNGSEIIVDLERRLNTRMSYDKAPLARSLHFDNTSSKEKASVRLYWDAFNNIYIEVICNAKNREVRGDYSFKHVDCYDSVENYFEAISGRLDLSRFSDTTASFVRAMLKDTRLHDEIRKRLNDIPKNTRSVFDQKKEPVNGKYKREISDYIAKIMDECTGEIEYLTNSVRNRDEFEESSIDDGSGLLVLRKVNGK